MKSADCSNLQHVKCQPVVDLPRQLIWVISVDIVLVYPLVGFAACLIMCRCGSHDRNLYALHYRNHCCVYKLQCGGSIFGSPAIDEVHETLYVSSTSGRVTAISVKVKGNFN
ncbi:hypothetical protein Pint_20852 [Pistacia integerrima]|uniref:Uncharacterized protein n=1 Tax=Pistacia integerrima TaxID=434235 RepID=A0ACC0XCG1_9ROSI|nr:hypothetical protein Pint_20852 [Pistacia integerrima]